jgi:hypothetical protein
LITLGSGIDDAISSATVASAITAGDLRPTSAVSAPSPGFSRILRRASFVGNGNTTSGGISARWSTMASMLSSRLG